MSTPRLLPSKLLVGSPVRNPEGESLGQIEDLVVDLRTGRIRFAVLSFGGFLGLGDKLFAIPWEAVRFDSEHRQFVLHVPRETLKQAPGFEKQRWPDMDERLWGEQIYHYYGRLPYWEEDDMADVPFPDSIDDDLR